MGIFGSSEYNTLADQSTKVSTTCGKLHSYSNTSNYLIVKLTDVLGEKDYDTFTYNIDKNDLNYKELLEKVKINYNKKVVVSYSSITKLITDIIVHSSEYTGILTNILQLEKTNYTCNVVYENYYELIFSKQNGCIFAIDKKECDKLDIQRGDNITIKYESMFDMICIVTEVKKN